MIELTSEYFSIFGTIKGFFDKHGYMLITIPSADAFRSPEILALPFDNKNDKSVKQDLNAKYINDILVTQLMNFKLKKFESKFANSTHIGLYIRDTLIFSFHVFGYAKPKVKPSILDIKVRPSEVGLTLLEKLLIENFGDKISVKLRTFSDSSEGNNYLELRDKKNFVIVQYSNNMGKEQFGIATQNQESVLLDLKPQYKEQFIEMAVLKIGEIFGFSNVQAFKKAEIKRDR